MKAHRGGKDIALSIHILDTTTRWFSMPSPGHFTTGKNLVSTVQETVWASELVWMGTENLSPPRFKPCTV